MSSVEAPPTVSSVHALGAALEPPCTRADVLVSVDELADEIRRGDPPVLLDVRFSGKGADPRPEFEAAHLPGAYLVDLGTQLAGPERGFSGRRPLPDPERLQGHIRSWGISADTPVVVYDTNQGLTAGRAWWVLTWAGVRSVRLLDGGLDAWHAAGHPSTSGPAAAARDSDFVANPGQLPTIDADQAAGFSATGVLLDSRAAEAYHGTPDATRSGHIAGAVSAPTRDTIDGRGLLHGEAALRARFAALGVRAGTDVGAYCGGGVAAAHEVLVLASLGIKAALFVGSWSAWSADPARPVVKGADPA